MKSQGGDVQKKLVVIDGLAYAYRGFYAVPEMSDASGRPTNAVFGFLNAMLRAQRQFKPDYAVVAWDAKGPTFRDELLKEYKAQRQPMPEPLKSQLPLICSLVPQAGWHLLEKEGFEADDVLATLARQGLEAGCQVVLMSTDKDILQLIRPGVEVYRENPKGARLYGPEAVKERFGVEPAQIPDLLALMGDSADNIPGVPGIGEKTAAQLLASHADLEAVLKAAPKMTKPKLSQSLQDFAEQARASRHLAVLVDKVPLSKRFADLALIPPSAGLPKELKGLGFTKLVADFSALLSPAGALASAGKPEGSATPGTALKKARPAKDKLLELEQLPDAKAALAWAQRHAKRGDLALLAHPLPQPERLLLAAKGKAALLEPLASAQELKALALSLPAPALWESKPFLSWLLGLGLRPEELPACFDLQVAGYLIHPGRNLRSPSDLSQMLGLAAGDDPGLEAGQGELFVDKEGLARQALLASSLAQPARDRLRADGLQELWSAVEAPLTPLLAAMERRGIKLDTAVLAELDAKAQKLMAGLSARVQKEAGREFNLNSPQQLAQVLFEEMKLPTAHKTKSGAYSTDNEVLEELAQEHAIARDLLEHRALAKLSGTYLQALPRLVDPKDGRLRTCWNQAVTTTGRLSSSDPNLQNIPIRTELGREIRKAFVPGQPKDLILALDYSQIELRVLAHFSGDEQLIAAFRAGEDIHARTAARVFGVAPGKVDAEMRRQAKVINFGVLYGMSPYGLSKQLGIPVAKAKAFIEGYFAQFPKVRACLDGFIQQARAQGFVSTLLGRRRYLPEVASANRTSRESAERMAVNAPIQGTAADLIKLAMLRVDALLRQRQARSCLLLQVHDELVLDLAKEEAEELPGLIAESMRRVWELKVPLEVSIGKGKTWHDAKG
jgi:DNA polymerase-1